MHANAAFGHGRHCALFELNAGLLDDVSNQRGDVRTAQALPTNPDYRRRLRPADGQVAVKVGVQSDDALSFVAGGLQDVQIRRSIETDVGDVSCCKASILKAGNGAAGYALIQQEANHPASSIRTSSSRLPAANSSA